MKPRSRLIGMLGMAALAMALGAPWAAQQAAGDATSSEACVYYQSSCIDPSALMGAGFRLLP